MTAASSRTPRTPYEPRHALTVRTDLTAPLRVRIVLRCIDSRHAHIESPRHAADEHTPPERTVPAIVERVR